MKEISYWDQFMSTGKVEDYLKFREQKIKEEAGETVHAGSGGSDRNDHQDGAYRGFR